TAASRPVYEADQRHLHLAGHALRVAGLATHGSVGRAASHGEVVTADHHPPSSDGREAHHVIRRGKRLQLGAVVLSPTGQHAAFAERLGVNEALEALADGEAAVVVVALDAFLTAELVRQLLAALEFLDLWFPRHRRPLACLRGANLVPERGHVKR